MHEVPSYYSFRANNTTLQFLLGSIASGKSPTFQPTTNPSGFIAKQAPFPPDSYSRRELNVGTLWLDARMMVSPTKLIVHFATSESISQSASPSHLKTEKSENDLRLFRKLHPQNYKNSFQKALSQHSTYGHKFSVLRVAGTEWENQCSNLLHLETHRCLILLLLICVFLTFLMMHCDKSFCKLVIRLRIARPMCYGRPFASPLFRRLAGRGSSFRGFPFWWAMRFALSPARRLTLHDSVPRNREGSQYQCSRTHDTLYCLFCTALWLGQGQSVLKQIQQTNDIDMTCCKILPTKSVTCLQVGPVAPLGRADHSSLSPSREDPNDGHLEEDRLAPPHLRWRRNALQPPEIKRGCLDRNTCVHIPEGGLRCVTWNTRGLFGSPFSSQTSRERKHNYFGRLTGSNDIICLQ